MLESNYTRDSLSYQSQKECQQESHKHDKELPLPHQLRVGKADVTELETLSTDERSISDSEHRTVTNIHTQNFYSPKT